MSQNRNIWPTDGERLIMFIKVFLIWKETLFLLLNQSCYNIYHIPRIIILKLWMIVNNSIFWNLLFFIFSHLLFIVQIFSDQKSHRAFYSFFKYKCRFVLINFISEWWIKVWRLSSQSIKWMLIGTAKKRRLDFWIKHVQQAATFDE